MGCCNSHQLDRKDLELILTQELKATPRSSSHGFRDVNLDSPNSSSLHSLSETPFPLHVHLTPAQSYKYFLETQSKQLQNNVSMDCSKDDTTVSVCKHLTRTLLLNMSQQEEEPSFSWKLRLETSLADQQCVSMLQNLPHEGDQWLSPPLTRSPDIEGSNISSISQDQERLDCSSLDFADMEAGQYVGDMKMIKFFRTAVRVFSSAYKPTFVSAYYTINSQDIKEFLSRQNLEFRETTTAIRSRYCPFCPKPHHEEKSNLFTLTFKSTSGLFHCFRCGANGSWYDFKNHMMGNQVTVEGINHGQEVTLPSESEHLTRVVNLRDGKYPEITNYLTKERMLDFETLLKFKVGVGMHIFRDLDKDETLELPSVYFPMFVPKGKEDAQTLTRVKVRAIHKEHKHHMKMMPVGGSWGFFGLNIVPPEVKTIVLTEGEYDAVAVHQATGLYAVSLPNGASHLPLQLLPWLEQFHKVYLWLDDDLPGREAAVKFAKKLGSKRTYIVKTRNGQEQGPKDANDAVKVMAPDQIKELINASEPLAEENIVTFRDLREEVYMKILKHQEESGIMSHSFHWYNEKTKGFRRGELSIVTGSTGSGKTTLLSQLSLDFCQQGIPTLWGSFEIKNEILLKKLLMQYSQCDLVHNIEKFQEYADRFQELPLYMLRFFGSTDVDRILETMDFAVYAYDIAHVVIDNLQFMISGQATGYAKFDLQDSIISRFRTFATEKNVHLTIVIHPKKVDDDTDLNISSVFGSAKATQEADNIFVLQNRHKYRLVDVRKNRYDGELGRVGLGFDKNTYSFFELTNEEVADLRSNPEFTMKDIITNRKTNK